MLTSLFRPFAIGTVAENKALRSKEIEVVPHEHLPFLDGELAVNRTPIEFSGVDADGNAYTGVVESDIAIPATWLPESSNRYTAPDVRRGERVILYTYGDTNQFYWRPLGLDDHLRKLETIVWAISATRDETKTTLDLETCYIVEFSSHAKAISISTCKADGEPFAYDIQLNTKDGRFTIQDDAAGADKEGNLWLFDSANTHFRMQNIDGTLLELKKIDVNVVVPGTLTGTVEKDINFSCENMNVTARSNFVAKVGADFSVDAGGSANVKAGSNVTLDAGANANVKAGSNVEAKAGGDLSLEAGGNFNAKGSMVNVESSGPAMVKGGAGLTLDGGGAMLVLSAGAASMVASSFSGG